MSYIFGPGSAAIPSKLHSSGTEPEAPTRRFERELASTFEGLLETQNSDQGRGYSFGAGCQRDSDGSAAVSLVEIQAGRERHALLFEECLAP